MEYKTLIRNIEMTLNQGRGNISQVPEGFLLTYEFHSGENVSATFQEKSEVLDRHFGVIDLGTNTYTHSNVGGNK